MPKSQHSSQQAVLIQLLRQTRETVGITQVDLAGRLAIQQSDVSKVERAVRRLDIVELRAWLAALDVPFVPFVAELDARLAAHEALIRQHLGTPGRRRKGRM